MIVKLSSLLLLLSTFSLTGLAEDWTREPSQAPLEPPYISEEEWEQSKSDEELAPLSKTKQRAREGKYEIIEETDTYYKVKRHPWAKKGLKRIKADGTYIFANQKSKIESFTGFRFGSQSFTNLSNPTNNKTFKEIYSSTTSVFLDFEKPLFSNWSKNLKWAYGINAVIANGQGFNASGAEAQETYTLIMLPLHTGLSYQFQYLGESQWIVPYVGAGVNLFLISEIRSDEDTLRTYTFGGHASAGLRFLMDPIMSDMDDLDEDYGINHLWLSLEYKKVIAGEPDTMDISGDAITLGFGLDI